MAANGGGFVGSSAGRDWKQLSDMATFKARSAVYRGQTEAQGDFYHAKVLKAQGLNDLIGGLVGAGGTGFQAYERNQDNSRLAASYEALLDAGVHRRPG